jgi:hypothetical protein
MFLLFNIFENALRTRAAIEISNHYSDKNKDNCWKDISKLDKNLLSPVQTAITNLHKDHKLISTINTFDIFDTFTFGQLEHIFMNYWNILKSIFNTTSCRRHTLPTLSREVFSSKIARVRNARNDIAHHKPIQYKANATRKILIQDIELILCYLGFNLKDALDNIDSGHDIIPHLVYH